MPILRLILLLGIASILLLFALQNWSPSIQLVFLGIRSPAFPLSLWVLGAIAAGILTALAIGGLFQVTGLTAPKQVRRPRSVEQPRRSYSYQASPQPDPVRQPQPARADEEDASDWFDDDTSWDDAPADSSESRRKRTEYEVPQEPKSGSRTGSGYSYSYRDPEDTNTKMPEPVVDADYRVIIPPHRNLDQDAEDDFDKRDR